ncbi:hypothetical protein CHCC14820_1992 [Bacillus paralicheniformis]|nr:hypothetical protein CHCC5023_3389 [Bacillus paralicheniformis]TWJ75121.1 hypothetical protein CHCC5019_1792 [Bacillus paralicheniformis]TWM36437.1 hypothetical protein CHCC14820_1992 [Bacillus paralicheniformis]
MGLKELKFKSTVPYCNRFRFIFHFMSPGLSLIKKSKPPYTYDGLQ